MRLELVFSSVAPASRGEPCEAESAIFAAGQTMVGDDACQLRGWRWFQMDATESRGRLDDRPGLLFVYANHFAGAKKDAEDL
jgi:hypothetical protein